MSTAPPTRILMLGTGDFALPTFDLLCETGHNVLGLVTQPDRPQGRKQEIVFSPIKTSALKRGLPVEQPEDVNAPEFVERLRALRPDLLVTAAYGQILSKTVLGIPSQGGINLHGSILPAYRGAAPVARAIQNGETVAGVTVILMTPRIDAGGMLSKAQTSIDPDETAGALEDRLAVLGAPLIVEAVRALAEGTAAFLPQDRAHVTKAPKLKKEDGWIDWTRSALDVHNLVRAMQPWPVASTSLPGRPGMAPSRLIVHATRCHKSDGVEGAPGEVLPSPAQTLYTAAGQGIVEIRTVQIVGKKPMPVADFLRGRPLFPGERLGSPL